MVNNRSLKIEKLDTTADIDTTTELPNRLLDRELVLKAVADEEELEGRMPDNIWEGVTNPRELEEMIRMTVRLTKHGIRKRIEAL